MGRRVGWAMVVLAIASCSIDGPTQAIEATAPATPTDAPPWAARLAAERTSAARDPLFAPRIDESGIALGVPGSIEALIGGSGARLRIGERDTTLSARTMGRGDARVALAPAASAEVAGPEVRIAHGAAVTEWWRALPSGLEHGIDLADRPAGEGLLTVEVAVDGPLSAFALTGDAVELRDASGAALATYEHVTASDADGRTLPAHLAVAFGSIQLTVDDTGALYPIEIDPLIVTQELEVVGPGAGVSIGSAVAMTPDATRLVVGLTSEAPRVYFRAGTTWTLEATLTPPDFDPADGLGNTVAIASDGSRAFVGAPSDDVGSLVDAGSVRVFLRTGTSWAPEAVVTPSAATMPSMGDLFGSAIAVDATGSILVAAASLDDFGASADVGSMQTFSRTGTSWAQTGNITGSAPMSVAGDRFGATVAVSADGTHLAVGRPGRDIGGVLDAGMVSIYSNNGSPTYFWTLEASLLPTALQTNQQYGGSFLAFDATGAHLLIGDHLFDGASTSDSGAAFLAARTGTAWAEEQTFVSPFPRNADWFGYAGALGSDGSRVAIGLPFDRQFALARGSVRLFERGTTAWAGEPTLLAADGAANDELGWAVALAGDGSRLAVTAPGRLVASVNAGALFVFTLAGQASGATCRVSAQCASGFCVDGVCCATACGGEVTTDCMACSAALTGGADGTCAGLSPSVAPTITCRVASGGCDVADVCTAGSTTCADGVSPSGTVCHGAAGPCDVAETCDGIAPACPADALEPTGTTCRAAVGPCDAPEVCNGAGPTCPGDALLASGVVCRAAVGACDVAESCDGITAGCPTDALQPVGHECLPAGGICDPADLCTGVDGLCPATYAPSTIACRPASGPCDVAETCSGTDGSCAPDLFMAAGTVCDPSVSGVCDAPDVCTGSTGNCPPTFATGVTCRPAVGACDIAETCSGTATACPPDVLVSAGLDCRPATDPSCDTAEVCDGLATSCPPDVTACVPGRDAGGADASATPDAGTTTPPAPATGCGCAVPITRTRPLGVLVLVTWLLLWRRRRCGVP